MVLLGLSLQVELFIAIYSQQTVQFCPQGSLQLKPVISLQQFDQRKLIFLLFFFTNIHHFEVLEQKSVIKMILYNHLPELPHTVGDSSCMGRADN